MQRILVFILFIVLLYSCKSKKNEPQANITDTGYVNLDEIPDSLKARQDSIQRIVSRDSILMHLTKEVFGIFKNKRYAALDSFIHPTEGIRFSPYPTVGPENKKFTRQSFINAVKANEKIRWGYYDGSGDPIVFTPREYFENFVYDANFISPEKIGINTTFKKGNSISNVKSFYQGCNFTESYFSGNKKNADMDWKSVKLVFKEINGKYYLVGVVHNQWTI